VITDTEIRAPRKSDAEAIVEAMNAHSTSLHGVAETSLDDVETWLTAPNLDPEHDIRVALDGDGRVLGYADVSDDGGEHRRYWADLRVRPDAGAATGAALLDAMEGRAREAAAPGAIIRGFLAGHDERTRALFDAHGYRLVRHSLRMLIELDGRPPEPDWPEGIHVRSFEPGADDEPVYEAHMESFADHWEFVRFSYEEWRHWMLRPPHDPSVWFLACDGDEIAGVCLCRPEETGEPDMGWVSALGVRPPWRRRGLAHALLRHAFAEFHRRGKAKVGLGVDAENTTGAVRLYKRAGMSIVRRYDIVEKLVAP
jgi:mycothiol synthase